MATNLAWFFEYTSLSRSHDEVAKIASVANINTKVLLFLNMFVEDVLNRTGEVDFETRLKLENAVRNINNPEILASWQSFTNAGTDVEAQKQTTSLLKILINRLSKPRNIIDS